MNSALVTVVPNATAGPSLERLVAATARPGEDLDVLRAGPTAAVLVAASSPPAARIAVPGRPAAPSTDATSFQQAEYRRNLARWQAEVIWAKQAVATRTNAAVAAWASSLRIGAKVGSLTGPAHLLSSAEPPGSLGYECSIAASTLAGLDEAVGASFGDRRVVVLYVASLDGSLPPGELTGDDVIVVPSFLPSAEEISAAQASLLAAGAARATILGPESTAAQLSQVVTLGLSQKVITEALSGAALFANDSSRLAPRAARVLTPVIALLREPGAAAVINGYASTPGSSEANYLLSYARAAAVAAFFEARGIPASSLEIVGHGATNLVATGPSGANRRVVVVIEEPAGT